VRERYGKDAEEAEDQTSTPRLSSQGTQQGSPNKEIARERLRELTTGRISDKKRQVCNLPFLLRTCHPLVYMLRLSTRELRMMVPRLVQNR